MIEISKSEIIRLVAALSAAEHFYSARGSADNSADVARPPMFTDSRAGLVSLWVEDACCDLMARLIGWASGSEYDGTRLRITLRGQYAAREDVILPAMRQTLALDVWRRMAAHTAPDVAERATQRMESAAERMLCLLMCRS